MKQMKEILSFCIPAICAVAVFQGCNPLEEFPTEQVPADSHKPWASEEISALSVVDTHEAPLSTKSLVDQTTTQGLEANFLRINEDVDNNQGQYTFNGGAGVGALETDWSRAYLLEGSVAASPDNTQGIYYRSTYFDPVQTYNIHAVRISSDDSPVVEYDTTQFYHTRMVGWYPRTCDVRRDQDGDAVASLFRDDFYSETLVTEDGRQAVRFTGLDGETDLMMSDVREGQHWHTDSKGAHYSDRHPDGSGKSIYRPPFGHYSQTGGPSYSNYFTFKHYLSAVRIFIYADQSPQNLEMWGDINSVTISSQPTSCVIELPQIPGENGKAGEFGEVISWGNTKTLDIIQTPMYGENAHEGDENLSVSFPVSIVGSTSTNMTYVGYALVRPDHPVIVGLHTSSGVYYVSVDNNYRVTPDADPVPIFKEGNIYDIHLNLQTGGTIAALLQEDAGKRYFDLTSSSEYSEDQIDAGILRYANCYIIDPDEHTYTDETGEHKYDGYCFSATVIGNGESGILSHGAQTLYPSSEKISPVRAQMIWESELGLISQVELLYGYVRFVINPEMRGNAVIGVYDDQDNILWSWHIWISEDSLTEMSRNISLSSGNTITVMDRNLGASKAVWIEQDDVLDTYGLYYQWGRKDPSMGPPEWNYSLRSLVTDTYYDFSLEPKNAAEVRFIEQPTLKDGIENPMYLVLPTGQTNVYRFNWIYENNTFLWGHLDNDHDSETVVYKTIYDPCPYGYRIAGPELTTLFSIAEDINNGITYTNYGQILHLGNSDLYFPYAGYKGVDRSLNSVIGAWRYVGEKGDYMSSWCETNAGTYYGHRSRLYISREQNWTETNVESPYTSRITHDATNRRTAASVRCVREEATGGLIANIDISTKAIVPGVPFTLSWNISSQGSNITSYEIYALVDEKQYPVTEGTPNQVRVSGSMEYTVSPDDIGLLGGDDIEFRIEAENGYGMKTFSSCSASAAKLEYLGWNGSDLYVGQSADIEFEFTGNLSSVSATVTYYDTSSSGDKVVNEVVDIIGSGPNEYGENTFKIDVDNVVFSASGNKTFDVKVYMTLASGEQYILYEASEELYIKDLVLDGPLTSTNGWDSDALYIITTSDGRVLAPDGDIGSYIGIEDTTPDYSDCFKIRSKSGSNGNPKYTYVFQSVVTENIVNNEEQYDGWFSTTIIGFQMGSSSSVTYYSLNIDSNGNSGIYYEAGYFEGNGDFYWTDGESEVGSGKGTPVTFKIYKVTN